MAMLNNQMVSELDVLPSSTIPWDSIGFMSFFPMVPGLGAASLDPWAEECCPAAPGEAMHTPTRRW